MAPSYRYFSADSHFECLPETWTHRIPAKYRDRAPRRIKLADGRDAIVVEGQPLEYRGTNLFAGKDPEDFNPTHLDFENAVGAGSPKQRLKEQDADGIDGELLFATEARNTKIKDKNAFLEIIRSFNDYFIEEYCSVDPTRLVGVAVMPDIGADEDITEMKRCKEKGYKAVRLHTFPSGKSYPTPEDDLFYAAALDLQMPLTIHTSFPRRTDRRDVFLMQYPKDPQGEGRPFDFLQRLARQGIYHCGAVEATQMIFSGVFDRFPALKIFWAENNIGWIPYFYEQVDQTYKINCGWAEKLLGLPRLKKLPSQYLREHAYWGVFDDPIGIELRHRVGVDKIMWSNDFPHIVTRWPKSQELIEEQFGGVPENEKFAMLAGNAVEYFHLDGK
jgi:predicted TIM-barrel fold metal-dependent hydrolase